MVLSEEHQQTRRCVSASLASAATLLVVGAVLLARAGYGEAHAAQAEAFNAVVGEWDALYAAQFNGTAWELRIEAAGEAPRVVPLEWAPAAPAPVVFAKGDDPAHPLSPYTPLKAGVPSVLTQAEVSGALHNGTSKLSNPRALTLLARRPDGAVDELHLGTFELVSRATRRTSGWKVCRYQEAGWYTGGQCVTYNALDSLCVKVNAEPTAGGAWMLDDRYGGFGCSPKKSWDIAARRRVRAAHAGAWPSYATVETVLGGAAPGAVLVRSAWDPELWARNATGGSMVLAAPEAEESAEGIVLVLMGAAVSIPGLVLGLPILRRWQRGRARQYEAFSSDDEEAGLRAV